MAQRRYLLGIDISTSAVKAAILAGVGAGVYHDLEDAVGRTFGAINIFNPAPAAKATYDQRFPIYRDLYDAVIGISSRLT